MSILIGILTAVHIIVALLLIVLVLMQKSSEQGVGAAFGGGMTDTVFGAGTTTALVRLTIWFACFLLATTLILAVLHSQRNRSGSSLGERMMQSAPAAPIEPVSQPPTPAMPATETAPVTPAAPAEPTPEPTP